MIDNFIENINEFYSKCNHTSHRFKSWENCYSLFVQARNTNIDINYLTTKLSWYLASWGMYRGSSFLLQFDETIHIPVIKEILKDDYNSLLDLKYNQLYNKDIQDKLNELIEFIKKYYNDVRKSIKEVNNDISNTLVTKILMGTLGCVPAYDRYFVQGIKKHKVSAGSFNIKSLIKLAKFYENNYEKLENIRNKMLINNKIQYPQMKIIDMGFWNMEYKNDK